MKMLSHVIASLFLALALATPTQAQTVYRCGNSYSQQPCPGGSAIDANDSRTAEQRRAHEESVRKEQRAGDMLEKNRMKEEAAAARAIEQTEKAERTAATKATPKATAAKSKNQHAKDKLPAYRAPVAPKPSH